MLDSAIHTGKYSFGIRFDTCGVLIRRGLEASEQVPEAQRVTHPLGLERRRRGTGSAVLVVAVQRIEIGPLRQAVCIARGGQAAPGPEPLVTLAFTVAEH